MSISDQAKEPGQPAGLLDSSIGGLACRGCTPFMACGPSESSLREVVRVVSDDSEAVTGSFGSFWASCY